MSSIPEIDPATADGLVADGALLLDVREPLEWAAGHAPNAVHIPLGELEQRVAELDADQPVVVICRSGARSLKAAEWLAARGFDAKNLGGGSRAWVAQGLRFVCDDGTAGTVD